MKKTRFFAAVLLATMSLCMAACGANKPLPEAAAATGDEEIRKVMEISATSDGTSRFTITLSGNNLSQDFEVTSDNPWAQVWVQNEGEGNIQFTITKGSNTGDVVEGSEVTIKAGTQMLIYATEEWEPDTYYANFTCGTSALKGSSVGCVAAR